MLGVGKKTKALPKDLQILIDDIDQYWDRLIVEQKTDNHTLIGLPNPYVVPSVEETNGFIFREQYYWDTLFVVKALLINGREELAIGMVDNLLYMLKKFGAIPNANRFYMLSRSQPPVLSDLVTMVYEQTKDKAWLKKHYKLIEREYFDVWTSAHHPHNRQAYRGLSRHYDINVLHSLAEAESGWDYTPRFENRCLDFLPIDLNCRLYKYETDLEKIHREFDNFHEADLWSKRAKVRKETINLLMWEETSGFFYDYDYVNERRGEIRSLAGFMPMYVKLADTEQAKALVKNLDWFSTANGLTSTAIDDGIFLNKQWASPNGWAPLQLLVVEGLMNYGYEEKARRIAKGYVKNALRHYNVTGNINEVYNLVDPRSDPVHGVYPQQTGFAWTNAVIYLFTKHFF